jgi:hypothetical protein
MDTSDQNLYFEQKISKELPRNREKKKKKKKKKKKERKKQNRT